MQRGRTFVSIVTQVHEAGITVKRSFKKQMLYESLRMRLRTNLCIFFVLALLFCWGAPWHAYRCLPPALSFSFFRSLYIGAHITVCLASSYYSIYLE